MNTPPQYQYQKKRSCAVPVLIGILVLCIGLPILLVGLLFLLVPASDFSGESSGPNANGFHIIGVPEAGDPIPTPQPIPNHDHEFAQGGILDIPIKPIALPTNIPELLPEFQKQHPLGGLDDLFTKALPTPEYPPTLSPEKYEEYAHNQNLYVNRHNFEACYVMKGIFTVPDNVATSNFYDIYDPIHNVKILIPVSDYGAQRLDGSFFRCFPKNPLGAVQAAVFKSIVNIPEKPSMLAASVNLSNAFHYNLGEFGEYNYWKFPPDTYEVKLVGFDIESATLSGNTVVVNLIYRVSSNVSVESTDYVSKVRLKFEDTDWRIATEPTLEEYQDDLNVNWFER